ncbi:hypothetical protein ACFODZ_16570 [Marinicella sediminis]|uniref:ImmA/IrrE family metallo-endopeptidase n=1 Tax=Marinicella sediminis TaxID=1792834 RepID=A0ABV7JCM1_9GAMM|nr:hypothetical protein [Marinicella sediminis]
MNKIYCICFLIITSCQNRNAKILGQEINIAGMNVNCGNVVTVIDNIDDIAMARPGYIILNPMFFNLSAPLQHFIYAHECAHHLLGSDEYSADCWAMKTGRDQGWLPPFAATQVGQAFLNSPGDWTHAPGPIRVQQMQACYNTP